MIYNTPNTMTSMFEKGPIVVWKPTEYYLVFQFPIDHVTDNLHQDLECAKKVHQCDAYMQYSTHSNAYFVTL